MALLEVRHLNVQLQTRDGPALAVRDVSFNLDRGQTLGLIDESGCGKSLTAMALMGLLPKIARTTGSIVLDMCSPSGGTERLRCSRASRATCIAMIFQEPMTALNPVHRIGRIAEGMLSCTRGPQKLLHWPNRPARLLDRVGIQNARDRLGAYPHELSVASASG